MVGSSQTWGKSVPGKANGKCRGPKVGTGRANSSGQKASERRSENG